MFKHTFTEYIKSSYIDDILTGIYVPLILLYLHNNGNLYKLGKYENTIVILVLAAAELLKVLIYGSNKTSRKSTTKSILKTIAVFLCTFGAFYGGAILLGAPAFSCFEETSMFALLMSTITALPLCLIVGPDSAVQMLLSLTSQHVNDINKPSMLKLRFTVFGSWLGATVIPLDWDRVWQEWPIPCCIGGLLGYTLGNLAMIHFQIQSKLTKKSKKSIL